MFPNGFMLRRFLYILTFLALLGTLWAAKESKQEVDLRARLAASETARAAALKEKAVLAEVLSRLSKTNAAVQGASQTASQSAGIAQKDAGLAQKDAGLAQDAAATLASITQQAANLAATAALVAQQQAAKSNSNSRDMIWAQIVILVGLFGGFANSAMRESRRHKWAMEADKRSGEKSSEILATAQKTELNTNSMVEIMRKSATDEGFRAGVASVAADPSPEIEKAYEQGFKNGSSDPS